MKLWEAIENRKSIRKFKPDPLSRVMLEEILQAAIRAPSAINTQPWECWVVGGETLQQLSRELLAEGTKGTPSRADFQLTAIWKDSLRPRKKDSMKPDDAKHFDQLIDIARENGATAARIISAEMVVIDERARLKCEVPRCSGYGHYLTCPPYVMPVGLFAGILSRYKWCLLVQVEAKDINSTDKSQGRIDHTLLKNNRELHRPFRLKLLQIVEAIEAAAFKKGLYLAAGFIGGSCVLCDRCIDDKTSEVCRHPFRARPPMEAVGINVIETAQKAGLPIHLSSSKNVLWTGLILLN